MTLVPTLLAVSAVLSCAGNQEAGQETGTSTPEAFVIIDSEVIDGVTQLDVSYPSDDLTVRGFLFLPAGSGRHPAVVFNHGGVSGVSGDMKRRSRNLAELGYVVLAPAYRGEGGSEGVVEVARGEVDDVLAGARVLAGHERVDPARMAVTGSSHGALISILAAAREPETFRCVVEACGVMDVVTWYAYLVENDFDVSDSLSVAVYGHGPEDKPEAFRIRQAIGVADRIKIPVLIQQGAMDRTVPPEQARMFAETLEGLGHEDVSLKEYPLLGHAFWFWNDLRYHTEEEVAQAELAWDDFTEFLGRHLEEK
jgi:dipeptidyl aminopeptidase/acylaminoacyl peptidase